MAGKLTEKQSKKNAAAKGSSGETVQVAKPPTKEEYLAMEKLVQSLDDEFSLSVNPEVLEAEMVENLFRSTPFFSKSVIFIIFSITLLHLQLLL